MYIEENKQIVETESKLSWLSKFQISTGFH